MKLNELEIFEDEFDVFVVLNDQSKIEFLFDAMEQGMESSIIKQVTKLDSIQPDTLPKQKITTEDIQFGDSRLCITCTDNQVYLNSDSLKAIRMFASKITNDGLLLWPMDLKKTAFDMYRYFKAFKIIGRVGPVSSN